MATAGNAWEVGSDGRDWYSKVFKNKHDVVNDFLERKADIGRSDRTLNTYSRTLKRLFHDHFPDLAPEEVQVRHIEEYLHILNNRGLKQNTKRRYLETLSAFFSWAMKRPRYDITGNPVGVLLEGCRKRSMTGRTVRHGRTRRRSSTLSTIHGIN